MPIPLAALAIGGGVASLAPLVGSAFRSPAEKQASRLAGEQDARAKALREGLGDRPIADAKVNRLNQLMAGNLGITDAERTAAERGINRSLSQTTSGVSSLGGGLRGLGQMTQAATDSYGNIAAESSRMTQANRLNLGQQLASAEAEAEYFNEITPYMEQLAEIQALEGAANENEYLAALSKTDRLNSLYEGIGQLGGSVAGAAVGMMNPSTLANFQNKLNGVKSGSTSPQGSNFIAGSLPQAGSIPNYEKSFDPLNSRSKAERLEQLIIEIGL